MSMTTSRAVFIGDINRGTRKIRTLTNNSAMPGTQPRNGSQKKNRASGPLRKLWVNGSFELKGMRHAGWSRQQRPGEESGIGKFATLGDMQRRMSGLYRRLVQITESQKDGNGKESWDEVYRDPLSQSQEEYIATRGRRLAEYIHLLDEEHVEAWPLPHVIHPTFPLPAPTDTPEQVMRS
jgi:hypothetical protein